MFEVKLGWQNMHTVYAAVLNAYTDVLYEDPDNEDEIALLLAAKLALEGTPSTSTGRAFIDCYYGETDE